MMLFRDFIFNKLPLYFRVNDSYKDNVVDPGKGLAERYLRIFGSEIDGEVSPYLDNFGYLWDAERLGDLPNGGNWDLLVHIADTMGLPPDVLDTKQEYAHLLKHILKVYQLKGSILGYKTYFKLLGYNVEVELANTIPNKYDVGNNYDTVGLKYDIATLVPEQIDLTISNIYPSIPPTPTKLELIKQSAYFITPINIEIRNLVYVNNNNFQYVIYNGEPVIYNGQIVTVNTDLLDN